MINKTSGTGDFIQYFLIIALFYLSGGAFSVSSYSTKIIGMFTVVLVLFLLIKKCDSFDLIFI